MIGGGRDEDENRMMREIGNIRRCTSTNVNLRRRASASGNSACAAASFLSPVARHTDSAPLVTHLGASASWFGFRRMPLVAMSEATGLTVGRYI